ncbi:Myb-like transcription factor [Chloropicon primus]|uniref:Uncharacterized protein n=1 Tax=Chloropicon primus TaxID=1764295 RepID=A0A5B8MRQ6_9CHLO|nr:hypothetical protein A3770_07p48530 [Chloropicon primus]UPR01551.1 Myb-like transcription factor [Chloropicon primus]|mmetsp:Transcript_1135/g.3309  ORF Transcript_1135/g.3309 Transcript_1135/m.3309 type:complete len:515 (+) Transcript_1135:442-1986(+)|eukprot:QDZ22335.1 hypothetical protein A3770_07p48530 [Chloropicon primus]
MAPGEVARVSSFRSGTSKTPCPKRRQLSSTDDDDDGSSVELWNNKAEAESSDGAAGEICKEASESPGGKRKGKAALPPSVPKKLRHTIGKPRAGWTKREEQELLSLVSLHGDKQWAKVAEELKTGRSGKQCRERWINHLRPDIRTEPWSDAEEGLLIEAHKAVGNRWSEIARRLSGRTENSIKNHWNSTLRSKSMNRPNSMLRDYVLGLAASGKGGTRGVVLAGKGSSSSRSKPPGGPKKGKKGAVRVRRRGKAKKAAAAAGGEPDEGSAHDGGDHPDAALADLEDLHGSGIADNSHFSPRRESMDGSCDELRSDDDDGDADATKTQAAPPADFLDYEAFAGIAPETPMAAMGGNPEQGTLDPHEGGFKPYPPYHGVQGCREDLVEVSELCPISVSKYLTPSPHEDLRTGEPSEVSSHVSLAPSSQSRVVTHKTKNVNILRMRLQNLCAKVRSQFDVTKVVLACRTEFLKVGEVFLVVVVGSKSHSESCRAVRYLRTELDKEITVETPAATEAF